MCLCRYSWSRYPPLPIAVLIFCTHWVRPNPINHVCECLISTLLALVSFSWLSARFIMAFGESVCGVCVLLRKHALKCVTLLRRRMSWTCSSCSQGGNQHADTHICFFKCVVVFPCVTLSLSKCVRVCECVYLRVWVCTSAQVCKKLDQVMVACVPVRYHGDSKWPFKRCPSGWWDQITSMKEKSRNKQGWAREWV